MLLHVFTTDLNNFRVNLSITEETEDLSYFYSRNILYLTINLIEKEQNLEIKNLASSQFKVKVLTKIIKIQKSRKKGKF